MQKIAFALSPSILQYCILSLHFTAGFCAENKKAATHTDTVIHNKSAHPIQTWPFWGQIP